MRKHGRSIGHAALVAGALCMWTGPAHAAEVEVETKGHRFFAEAGESGGTFDVSAMLTVLVTFKGLPVTDLGASIPLDTDGISLPPVWSLNMPIGPPGPLGLACQLDPTEFINFGNGTYAIRVVPLLDNPICRWGLGDYHYVVGIGRGRLNGSALGVLTIPDTPAVP